VLNGSLRSLRCSRWSRRLRRIRRNDCVGESTSLLRTFRRLRLQIGGALAELNARCAERQGQWLVGDTIGQADITLACYANYLREAVPFDLSPYPALLAHCDRCEALPVFRQFHVPFDAPVPTTAQARA